MAEHFLGRGSYWTRLHPPIKVLEVVPGNKELEAAKTIALMCRVGLAACAWSGLVRDGAEEHAIAAREGPSTEPADESCRRRKAPGPTTTEAKPSVREGDRGGLHREKVTGPLCFANTRR
jgi:hypothetical protein